MKKYIAPVIITFITIILMGGYALLYIYIFSQSNFPLWVTILTGVVFLGLILAMFAVLKARITELKKENTDDYRKY